MLAWTLSAWAVILCFAAATASGKIKFYQMMGGFSLASALFMISSVIQENTALAMIDAGLTAFYGYLWWKGGGGDGTRRRLRKIAKAFEGTRRTAPVQSGA